MTFAKLQQDWYVKVAAWRSRAPKQRFAAGGEDLARTRYWFALPRFVHHIEATTICQMEVVKPDYSDVT